MIKERSFMWRYVRDGQIVTTHYMDFQSEALVSFRKLFMDISLNINTNRAKIREDFDLCHNIFHSIFSPIDR